jgi:hypothetical protein
MSSLAFGVHTPRELLERAEFEVRRLEESANSNFILESEGKNTVGSLAGACASTLWNIVDWLSNTNDPQTRALLTNAGFNSYESIREHVKSNSPELALCWEVTNGYKHCELSGHTLRLSQIDKAMLSAPPLSPDRPLAYQFVPKIKTKAGANMPAVQVFQDAVAFWRTFFGRLGL